MARYVKGQSGNPAGRPKGSQNRHVAFREAVDASLGDLVDVLIKKALEGDMIAMRLVLERSIPKVIAEQSIQAVDLPPTKIELIGVSPGKE